MRIKKITLIILLIISCNSFSQIKPVKIIFDSDMGPDYDDVGAITILHALADSGYAKILATISSSKYESVASVFNIFNSYFKRENLPIGIPKGKASLEKDWQHWTDTILAKFLHRIKKNSEVPDAVELYRKSLALQPDKSVTIVTVGFLTNLSNLLDSKPDKYSSLSGLNLIKRKVQKLVCMAGKFPSGKEFNVFSDSLASKKVFENWPTQILFDGFEIGEKIKTGLPLINNNMIKNSPVKEVFRIAIPLSKMDAAGRMSWDEIAVLIAIKGYKPWFTTKEGRIVVEQNGSNKWDYNGKGHAFIEFAKSIPEIQDYVNRLMMHQPK